jgi:hypothetical protein
MEAQTWDGEVGGQMALEERHLRRIRDYRGVCYHTGSWLGQRRADATPGPIPSPLSYDITVVDHLVSRV